MRTITLRDVALENNRLVPCPLGQGIVDWAGFFGALARARFSGPLTLQIDYRPEDKLQAIQRDLAFARKQLNAAYGKEMPPAAAPPVPPPLL